MEGSRFQAAVQDADEAVGELAECGLVAGAVLIEQLQRRITELEQSVVDLTCQLSHRDDELAAARAANREMIAQINRTPDRL